MKLEGPRLTKEEIAKEQKERILTEAELVKDGADVTPEGETIVTEDQKNSAKLEMGDAFYKQNQELKHKELELKLALVRKEIEAVEELNWWQKEYEGYDVKGKKDFAEVEEFLQGLPDNDKEEIIFKAKRGMRYKEFLNWLREGTAHKYGANKIEKTMGYFSSQQDLGVF